MGANVTFRGWKPLARLNRAAADRRVLFSLVASQLDYGTAAVRDQDKVEEDLGGDYLPISCATTEGLEELKDHIYETFQFIRIYLKPREAKQILRSLWCSWMEAQ